MVFKKKVFLLLLQHLVMLSIEALPVLPHHLHHSLQSDKQALLEFKRFISSDPNSSLSNWNETTDVCQFAGIRCNRHRVSNLRLPGAGLVGPLSPFISNLTGLRIVNLSDNQLFGIIPIGISSLRHLQQLWLDDNQLHGTIPDSFSFLSNLESVSVVNNSLTGNLPPSLFSNCTALKYLDVSQNSLSGEIPTEIGNCRKLWNLNLYNNRFTGEIPFSLTNASDMYSLDVEYNGLSGELPSGIVAKLARVVYLHLSYNKFLSHNNNSNLDMFFAAVINCSQLYELELAGMGLGGFLPDSIGLLSVTLKTLLLQENKIFGSVPPGLANLTSLINLNLSCNFLNGTILLDLRRLKKLDQLFLSHNFFSGEIPGALGQSPHLGLLDLPV